MKLVIEINLENDAFGSDLDSAGREVSTILSPLVLQFNRAGIEPCKLRDRNGNTVGFVAIQDDVKTPEGWSEIEA